MLLGMLAGRLIAVGGLRPYVYVDSAEYLRVDFSGASRRPWATPVLFWLLGRDQRYEVWGQAVVGAIAWTVLAMAAMAWFERRWTRVVVAVAICGLGLTTSVTNWDATVLSESLAISLTVLVVAAWLVLARRQTPGSAAVLLLATLPWLFVRQSLLPTAWLVVVATIAAAVATRGSARKVFAGVAVGLVLLTGLATVSYNRNQEVVQTNLSVILAARMAPHPDRVAWFRSNGMPPPPNGQWNIEEMQSDPTFSRWLAEESRGTYAKFLLTHPWYSLTAPLPDLFGQRQSYLDPPATKTTMLSPGDAYGPSRPVIPEQLEDLLFQPSHTGLVLTALLLALAWSAIRWRWADGRWILPLALVGLSVLSLLVGWHGANPELPRLSIVAALVLRVGLILQLATLVEAELRHRRPVAEPVGTRSGTGAGPSADLPLPA